VTGANRLQGQLLRDIIEFANNVTARLWLVNYQAPKDTPARRGALTNAVEVKPGDFADAWLHPTAHPVDTPPLSPVTFPRVPDTWSPSFLADCRDLLDPIGHRQVEQLFYNVQDDLSGRFASGEHGIRVIANTFHDWFERLPCTDQIITAARAVEAAAALDRYHVAVDIERLRAIADREPRPATRNEAQWDGLRIYASTDVGAYCALYAAELTNTQIPTVRMRHVIVNGPGDVLLRDPTRHGEPIKIAEGALYLAAQHRFRQLSGAKPNDLLFTTQNDTPVRPETSTLYARLPALEVGLDTVPTSPINRRSVRKWVEWCGISIGRIGGHQRAS
jgi:hypothetical protein